MTSQMSSINNLGERSVTQPVITSPPTGVPVVGDLRYRFVLARAMDRAKFTNDLCAAWFDTLRTRFWVVEIFNEPHGPTPLRQRLWNSYLTCSGRTLQSFRSCGTFVKGSALTNLEKAQFNQIPLVVAHELFSICRAGDNPLGSKKIAPQLTAASGFGYNAKACDEYFKKHPDLRPRSLSSADSPSYQPSPRPSSPVQAYSPSQATVPKRTHSPEARDQVKEARVSHAHASPGHHPHSTGQVDQLVPAEQGRTNMDMSSRSSPADLGPRHESTVESSLQSDVAFDMRVLRRQLEEILEYKLNDHHLQIVATSEMHLRIEKRKVSRAQEDIQELRSELQKAKSEIDTLKAAVRVKRLDLSRPNIGQIPPDVSQLNSRISLLDHELHKSRNREISLQKELNQMNIACSKLNEKLKSYRRDRPLDLALSIAPVDTSQSPSVILEGPLPQKADISNPAPPFHYRSDSGVDIGGCDGGAKADAESYNDGRPIGHEVMLTPPPVDTASSATRVLDNDMDVDHFFDMNKYTTMTEAAGGF